MSNGNYYEDNEQQKIEANKNLYVVLLHKNKTVGVY